MVPWNTPKMPYSIDLVYLLFLFPRTYSTSQCGVNVPVYSSHFHLLPTLARTHTCTRTHAHTHTYKVFWEDVQLPRWEWLMTPFTAQTPHNQRCWGSVSARCPVWVITPGTQLIYYPTINPAVHTCCPLQCPSISAQRWLCHISGRNPVLGFYFFLLCREDRSLIKL